MAAHPNITVFYLEGTRAFRPIWLLEELGVPYKIESAPLVQDADARQAFNAKSQSPLGKYPAVHVGDEVLHESGAVVE